MLRALAATVEAQTQAGASQLPRVPKNPLTKAKELEVQTILGRLRVSYPTLRACEFDTALCQLIIAECVSIVER